MHIEQPSHEPYELVVDQSDRAEDAGLVESAMAARARRPGDRNSVTITEVDLLLDVLRQSFRERYHGWEPTVDKNHTLDWVQGAPVKKGGARPPRPLEGTDVVPEFIGNQETDRASGSLGTPQRAQVGILDTKLFPHSTLSGKFVADSASILHSTANLYGTAGHATFIAGLILQRGPRARLDVRGVLSDDDATALSWEVAKKMAGFLNSGVDVLNMSFGCATQGKPPLALARAVDLLTPSIVLVAAAGNYGTFKDGNVTLDYTGPTENTPQWPAAFADVVAVGAHGAEADFSPDVPWIDLMAPGVDAISTFLPGSVKLRWREDGQLMEKETDFGNGYAKWSGTSFAAANVSGEIAARMGAHVSAIEALDALLHPKGGVPEGDIWPYEIGSRTKIR